MNNNFGKIRSFGFFSMIFLSLVGFGMFTYSQTMGKILGSNGIFLTIVYGLIYMILVGMIYKTFKINEFKPLEFIFEDTDSIGKIECVNCSEEFVDVLMLGIDKIDENHRFGDIEIEIK